MSSAIREITCQICMKLYLYCTVRNQLGDIYYRPSPLQNTYVQLCSLILLQFSEVILIYYESKRVSCLSKIRINVLLELVKFVSENLVRECVVIE